jgi:carbon storage regulator CsrA
MLVLTRKTDEQILIGDNIKITLVRVRGNSVRIGIEAPRDVRIVRGELESNESKAEDVVEFALSDREEVFAHPEANAMNRRAGTPRNRLSTATPNREELLDQAQPRQIIIGRVRRADDPAKLRRAPLAGFVSAS